MTLSLKIKHTGPNSYGARISRAGIAIAEIEPGQEVDVTLWDGAPLAVEEYKRDAGELVPPGEPTPPSE